MAGRIAGKALVRIGQTFFPHFCMVCGKEGRLLCKACETQRYSPERGCLYSVRLPERVRSTRPAPEGRSHHIRCFSAGRYADPVLRELLHLHKYGRVEEAGEILADFLAQKVGRQITALLDGDTDPVVVAVPMNRVNLAIRGFNQAGALAHAVARELDLVQADDIVSRRYSWRPQARLADVKKRSSNVSGAFVANGNPCGRDIMIVDDVFTTGATVGECAKALAEAGAGRITVVTALKG